MKKETIIPMAMTLVGAYTVVGGLVEFVKDLKTKGKFRSSVSEGIAGFVNAWRFEFGKYYTAAQVEAWAEDIRRRNETFARDASEWAEDSVDGGMCSFLEDKVKKCMDRHHHDGSTTTPVPSPCQMKVMFLAESLQKAGILLSTTTSTTT